MEEGIVLFFHGFTNSHIFVSSLQFGRIFAAVLFNYAKIICIYGKFFVILQAISVISLLESTRNPTCSKMELVRTLAKIATVEVTI